MEFGKLIESRRSTRAYSKERKVTKEQIEEVIYAALQAPSWKNSETARYYCILDDKTREKFLKECLPEYNANNAANAGLIVTAFESGISGFNRTTGKPENECGNGWGFYDLGLQNENLMLRAKELGLDTLVMGLRDSDAIRKLLNIPDTQIIVSVIAIGYGERESVKPERKAIDEVLKFM